MIDPYELLELKPGATDREIKNAYRRLAKKYHPDISKEPNAEERFIEITEAYDQLLNGTTQFSDLGEIFEQDAVDGRENSRRQRAREYANMKYNEFVQNNSAFKHSWYYYPTKYLLHFAIYIAYTIGTVLSIAPLVFWVQNNFQIQYFWLLLVSLVGLSVIKSTYNFQKELKPYFDN